ncbi:SMC-Scp complex subunit ScpB [Acetoanaerobium sticklandii]|uniref:SMC-Scp complex subunit ScpB n=1 Tax=Acetoanaerobium sticklandii TaxID=1511 RepID=UPI003A8EB870
MDKQFHVESDGQIYLNHPKSDKINKIISVCESLMFAYGDLISFKDIQAIFKSKSIDVSLKEIRCSLELLKERYKESESGLELVIIDEKMQLATKSDNYDYISLYLHPIKKKSLTQASLETLSIIAYKQPITKPEIENIRGVKCDKAIATLLEANLIEEAGRLDKIGKPIIYKTTEMFLKQFSIESLKDLPVLKEDM